MPWGMGGGPWWLYSPEELRRFWEYAWRCWRFPWLPRGWWLYPTAPLLVTQLTKEDEIAMLEEEAKAIEQEQKALKQEFEEIRKRIEELKKKK